jgi:hypothetical protein
MWREDDSERLDLVDKDGLMDPTLGTGPVLLKDYFIKTKQRDLDRLWEARARVAASMQIPVRCKPPWVSVASSQTGQ